MNTINDDLLKLGSGVATAAGFLVTLWFMSGGTMSLTITDPKIGIPYIVLSVVLTVIVAIPMGIVLGLFDRLLYELGL